MASPDFHSSPADTDAVQIDVEQEPSLHSEDEEAALLNLGDHGTNSRKKIDYVLVYERCQEEDDKFKKRAEKHAKMRRNFEQSLERAGLELDRRPPEDTERDLDLKVELRRQFAITQDLAKGIQPHKQISMRPKIKRYFVLIHASWEVLAKHAEEMHLKAACQKNDVKIEKSWLETKLGDKRNPLVIHDLKDQEDFFMANFRQDRLDKFVNHHNKEEFFDNIDRVYIVQRILNSACFGSDAEKEPAESKPPGQRFCSCACFRSSVAREASDDQTEPAEREPSEQRICFSPCFHSNAEREASDDQTDPAEENPPEDEPVGLKKMIVNGAYVAGYPLHDGPDVLEREESPKNDRQRLKRDWARPGRTCKYQPYDAINKYFGSEIAMYFAWVGFYTGMLVPLAITGLIVFLYGIGSAGSHIPVKDVCDETNKGKWYMCPLCDKKCSFWDLASTTCMYAYVTHFFDNDGTIALAVIASIWGTLFLEFWKRRQGILAHKWRMDSLEEEEPLRSEFPASEYVKKNMHTGEKELRIPKIEKYGRLSGVVVLVLTMITLVIAAVMGVIIYRAAVFASLSGHTDRMIQTRAKIITSATAALLNLAAINLMKFIYNKLAVWLTDFENPPTRSAYEYSFTWKMYLFQFVNTYASVFYIAFFKSGHVIGTPGKYERIAEKFRLDGCSEQGCFLELCVQLFILMVGQQIIGIVMEVVTPYLQYRFKIYMRNKKKMGEKEDYQIDFDLSPFEDHFMFWEYLQVVLQYGFATMFVAAFPLGPLFALLSSAIRIRADAFNFVSQFRRPNIIHAKDIGAWYRILKLITKVSILVNAFVLAFTSEFIPKLLYRVKYSSETPGEGTLTGYINNSLSSIHTTDIFRKEPGTEPEDPFAHLPYNDSVCRYRGYHEDFWPYNFSKQYWELTAVRLAFVFVFQFTVFLVSNSITYLVPDVPKSFASKKKREKELIKTLFENKVLTTSSTQIDSVISDRIVEPLPNEHVENQPAGQHTPLPFVSEDAEEPVDDTGDGSQQQLAV